MITAATSTVAPAGPTTGAFMAPVVVAATAASPVVLDPLADLPGLAHALLTDTDAEGHDRRVLAEIGTDEGTAAAVLAWGGRAAAVAHDRDLALDDVIVTTDAAHHLLRVVGSGWVYLRIRREDGNLALARRRLAALASARTPAASRLPAELPAGRSSTPEASAPAPSTTPPAAVRSTSWPNRTSPPIRPPAVTPTSVSAGPATSTAALAPAALPAPPSGPSTPSRPPTRPSAPPWASPPSGSSRGPSAPSPARELPGTAPELPSPRRPPGASVPPPPAPPARDEAPDLPQDSAGVLGQRWRSDPETLRRVLAGLLRLGRTPRTALAGTPEAPTTRSPGATPTRRNP